MIEVIIYWDPEHDPDSNVQHLADHGVSKEDASALFRTYESRDHSRSTGYPMIFGHLPDGRYITIVYDEIDEFPWAVYPIAAYEVPAPRQRPSKRPGKRKRGK